MQSNMNGIVFLFPEGTLEHASEMRGDWKMALATKTTEWTQENYSNIIPIIGEWDYENQNEKLPSIAKIVNAKEESDLPAIYLVHPETGKSYPYPQQMENLEDFSPDLVMAWAKAIVTTVNLHNTKLSLSKVEKSFPKEKKLEEGETQERRDQYLEHLSEQRASLT